MRARPNRAGFTLVELMITLALIAIIGAIATPLMLRTNAANICGTAARSVASAVQQARLMAQRDNRPYYVDFGLDLNGDGQLDCVTWRPLGNGSLAYATAFSTNSTITAGIPDQVVADQAMFLGATSSAYGHSFPEVSLGLPATGPAAGPPGAGGVQNARFVDPITGAVGTRFQANQDGSCNSGYVYLGANSPDAAATVVAYCVLVSQAGSTQVWRWTASQAVWQRL